MTQTTLETGTVLEMRAVNVKKLAFLLSHLVIYALIVGGIMRFYQDDPAMMELGDRQEFNLKYLSALSQDKIHTATNVIDYLGPPDITEAKQVANTDYQVMFYLTDKHRDHNITTKAECTALLFVDGLLIAWGEHAYQQYQAF